MTDAITYDMHCHVARITLCRPEAGNVVNLDMLDLLHRLLVQAEADPDCRAIVLQGSGGVFSRGMDFGFMLQKKADEGIDPDFGAPYARAVMQIRNTTKPVIAAVDGEVVAGGTGLALACDLVIATERSLFGLTEMLFGIIPAYVFPLLLERVTFKRARYLVLSSQKLAADKSLAFGLFDEVVPNDKLEKALTGQLKRLLYASPDALAVVKTYSDTIKSQPIETAMEIAATQLADLLKEKKNTDAITGFMEGEKMPWAVRYRKKKA